MGSSKGWSSLGGGLANVVTGGFYGSKKAAKQQKKAADAMADAISNAPKPAPTPEMQETNTDMKIADDVRRRYKLSDTVKGNSSLSGLSGMRKTLG